MFSEAEVSAAYGAEAGAGEPPRKRKRTEGGPVPPPSLDAEAVRRAIARPPVLDTMPALLRDHPHTAGDSQCALALDKVAQQGKGGGGKKTPAAAPAPGPATLVLPVPPDVVAYHMAASQQVPYAWNELKRRREAVTEITPRYRVEGQADIPAQADLWHNLRMGALSLPVYTARHETQLLVEAGEFVVVHERGNAKRTLVFPACMRGERCEGRRLPGAGGGPGGFTLMRAMSPEQWALFCKDGTHPPGQAPCVLCHRAIVSEYVYYRRLMGAAAPDDTTVSQIWCNRVGQEGGYFREYVVKPDPNEAIVSPLCKPVAWALCVRAIPRTTQRRVDQSALVWKPEPPLVPRVGEKMQSF